MAPLMPMSGHHPAAQPARLPACVVVLATMIAIASTACSDSSGEDTTAAESSTSDEGSASSTDSTDSTGGAASGDTTVTQGQDSETSEGNASETATASSDASAGETTSNDTTEAETGAGSDGAEASTGGDELCGERTGGALIEFELKNPTLEDPDRRETWRLWLTNSEFIDRAIQHHRDQTREAAVFSAFIDGRDCDTQWSFSMDSDRVAWGEPQVGDEDGDTGSIPTDSCNGLPGDVEGQKDYWFSQVQILCPADVGVLAVDDRRP